MKKILCIALCCILQMGVIHGDSYVVMTTADNTIVDSKNKDEKQSVASISKIMTAIIAIEEGKLDESWNCSKEISKAYGSSIYLKEGQSVSLRSLLYGLLLRSGNDAAVEIAKHVAGSQEAFVSKMNDKANQIGMSNTTFSNPSGLDESDMGNVSTANDMAILMSYAMKNEEFCKITGAKYYTSEWNYRWKNKNKLLFEYPFTTGGKTGFTKKAGRTLVTSATHEGVESVVVTLKTDDDFTFHESKHSEVFNKMDVVTVLKKGTYVVDGKSIRVEDPIKITLRKDGSDTLRVKTHFEQRDFVVEVQKNNQVSVYTYRFKSTKKNPLQRLFS